jgi:hypothetical protein
MTRDTLSTLDLHEHAGNRITWIRRVRHDQQDGRAYVRPGERVFAVGAPHHDAHIVMAEREEQPATAMAPGARRPGDREAPGPPRAGLSAGEGDGLPRSARPTREDARQPAYSAGPIKHLSSNSQALADAAPADAMGIPIT